MTIPNNWTFKEKQIAVAFDNHVREQLPWYDLASGAVAHFARHYIPENGTVYDLGCSTGNIGELLAPTLRTRNVSFHPIDNSPAMSEMYRSYGTFELADVSTYKFLDFDVAISMLCMMFLTVQQRTQVIQRLFDHMNPGGVIIIVDKFENPGAYFGTALARLTLAGKVAGAAPDSEIIAKELSLIGVQRPMGYDELIGTAQSFFQFGEFEGWILSA